MSRDRLWEALFLAVWGLRVWLCLQPPTESSDLYRNLGYAQQTFTAGASVYDTVARNYAPQFWARFWPDTGYMYPPFILTFFAVFSGLGLGLFWVKLALTLCDLTSSLVVMREFGKLAGFLVFAAPISLWYTSHEGQFESLMASLTLGAVVLAGRGRWRLAGLLWVLAIQTKQFAVLLAPFILAQALGHPDLDLPRQRLRNLGHMFSGMVIGILPFMPFYLHSLKMWSGVLTNQALLFNPYHWNVWSGSHAGWSPPWLTWWDGVSSYLVVILGLAYISRRIGQPLDALKGAPLISFMVLVKSLNWAQFWYPIAIPAFAAPLGRRGRWVIALLLIYALFDGNSARLLIGFGNFGVREWQNAIDRFASCRYTCDYSAS